MNEAGFSAAARDVLRGAWSAVKGLFASIQDAEIRRLLASMLLRAALLSTVIYVSMQFVLLPVSALCSLLRCA
jgi:hypothetical protein